MYLFALVLAILVLQAKLNKGEMVAWQLVVLKKDVFVLYIVLVDVHFI